LLCGLSLGGIGLARGVSGSGLRLLNRLILTVQFVTQCLNLLLLLGDRGLLRRDRILQCLHIGRSDCRGLRLLGFSGGTGLPDQRRRQKKNCTQLPHRLHSPLLFFCDE
jgi:hypothetical protein